MWGLCGKEFIVGDIQDHMREGKTSHGSPSYPHRDIYMMLFNLTMEKGACLTPVFAAIKVLKDFICTISSSNLLMFEQPERMRVVTDVN
jgi:hypothetical protein